MSSAFLVLAEAPATIHYKFARLQTFAQGQWWHALLLIVAVLAISTYAMWMYRKDSVELPRGLAILLCLLRLCALAGILFYFFGLEKRAERKLVKNSRALLLIDTSQSMGLRDPPEGGATNVPATMSRAEQVAAELANGPLIQRLREKHDVVAYRFDQAENPIEVASFPRKPTPQEIAESKVSEEDRLNKIVAESRWLVYIAAGVFGVSIIAGLVYVLTRGQSKNVPAARASVGQQPRESESWSLLATITTLIAALVILAVACLRGSEAGILAVVGIRPARAASSVQGPSTSKSETALPAIDWVTQLVPRGGETRIGDNLQFLIDKERGGPIAAIVLFTDGCNNAGGDCRIAASTAKESLIPIYTVGLGSNERPPNLRIVDLEAPERVYPGDKFSVTGYVQAQNYAGGGLTIELMSSAADGSGESKEDEQTLDVGRSSQVVPIKFELKPEEQGIRQYKLRVRPFEGEIDRRDNEKTAKVEIIDRRTKVLLMAGGPMRDFIFLRNQLFRDKEVVSDVWLQSGKPGISQDAHEILYKFPETADELFEYDAIVAFDPDWEQLDELQVKLLERWVAEKAGGLIIVTGPVFTPQWSSRKRGDPRTDTIKALYPVVFHFLGSATLNLGRFGAEKAWPLEFTADGRQAEFLWLDDNFDASQRAWAQFEGVCGYYAVKDAKHGARVYARFGDPDTAIDNTQPIYLAGQFYGSGRVFFMASGEMWRLRAVDDAYFEQFYTKLIRWASEGRLLRDSSRGVLLVDKDRAALGDQIAVRAILQDAQHRPLNAEQVQAMLVQPDTTRKPLVLKKVKDEGRDGIFVEQFTALQEGDYRIELQHPAAAEQILLREVRIKIPAKELEFPERNDALLREIADKSGGDYVVGMPAAASISEEYRGGLAARIKPQDQATILPGTPDRAFERQLMGWLLALICGALSLEWLLRRLSKLA
jgi:hypothetical protein